MHPMSTLSAPHYTRTNFRDPAPCTVGFLLSHSCALARYEYGGSQPQPQVRYSRLNICRKLTRFQFTLSAGLKMLPMDILCYWLVPLQLRPLWVAAVDTLWVTILSQYD